MTNLTYDELTENGYFWIRDLGLVSTKGYTFSRVMKPATLRGGYLRYGVWIDGRQRHMLQHRIVFEAAYGTIPPGTEINHINSIRHDNRIENLEVVTRSENMKHGYEFGNMDKSGEKNGQSKLTEKQVREIYGLAKQGLSKRKIAARFKVSRRQVGRILRGRCWKNIYEGFNPHG